MSQTHREFNDTQERIISVVNGADSGVVSSHIKDEIDTVGRTAVEKQIWNLVDMDVIEVVDERVVGGGDPAKVYGLTDEGGMAAKRICVKTEADDSTGKRAVDPDRADSLQDQVNAVRRKEMDLRETVDERESTIAGLREELEQKQSQLDRQAEELERHEEMIDELKGTVEDIYTHVNR